MFVHWTISQLTRASFLALTVATAVTVVLGCSKSEPRGAAAERAAESDNEAEKEPVHNASSDSTVADDTTLTAAARHRELGSSRADGDETGPSHRESEKRAGSKPTMRDVDGLQMRRLMVAEHVEQREPVDAGRRFAADSERIYAFMELRNDSDRERTAVVTFEGPGGRRTGLVTLSVPPHRPRWRTWAYSQYVSEPGSWQAVVRTPDGELLGRIDFQIVGPRSDEAGRGESVSSEERS